MLSQADAATPPAVDLLAELRQDPDADGDASSTPGIAAPTAAPIVRQLFSPSEQLSDSPATLAHHHQAKAESAHVGSSSTTASLSPLAAADATAAATAAAEMAVDASPPDSASQAMHQPESPADSAADSESVDPNEDTSAETSETDPDESTNHAYGNVLFSQMEVLALKLMFSLFDRSVGLYGRLILVFIARVRPLPCMVASLSFVYLFKSMYSNDIITDRICYNTDLAPSRLDTMIWWRMQKRQVRTVPAASACVRAWLIAPACLCLHVPPPAACLRDLLPADDSSGVVAINSAFN